MNPLLPETTESDIIRPPKADPSKKLSHKIAEVDNHECPNAAISRNHRKRNTNSR
jgi:hypothetical protein